MIKEIYISVTALVISIFAASFAGLQSYLIFQHNRVSVAPKLDWRLDYNEPKKFVLRIRLLNAGLGPAIIRRAAISIDDQSLGSLSMSSCSKVDVFLGLDAINHKGSVCWTMKEGEEIYMNPKEEIIVYQVGEEIEGNEKWIAPEKAHKLGVYAEYCSFYNNCETLE